MNLIGCEEAPVVSEEVGTRHNSKTGTESTEKSSDSIRFKGQPQVSFSHLSVCFGNGLSYMTTYCSLKSYCGLLN